MPRKALPIHLRKEKARRNASGEITHVAKWVIIDGKRKRATGCGIADLEGAQAALEAYLVEKHGSEELKLPSGAQPSDVSIADAIRLYVEYRGDQVARPDELASRMERILGWWSEKTLADISKASCRRYIRHRSPHDAASRRELEDLRSAVRHVIAERNLSFVVHFALPDKPEPRAHFMSRDLVARLVWHAYRTRERQVITRGPRKGEFVYTKKRPARHLARFILFALYTGSRSKRVWNASFERRDGHPWIDVESGMYHRLAPGEKAPRNKQAPMIALPGRLLAHCRRWKSGGADPEKATTFLCEYRRGKPGDTKKAFARLIDDVCGETQDEIVRHTLRHTAASWLIQADEDVMSISKYLGMKPQTLLDVYAHADPEFHREIGVAFTSGRAGRKRKAS